MPNLFRHLKINKEILKQVQDDALVGGYGKGQENDSIRGISSACNTHHPFEASCRRANGGSASQPEFGETI
jgi:hypothetical protein